MARGKRACNGAADLGGDVLTGGAGADRFLLKPGDGADRVTDFSCTDGDRIELPLGTAFTVAANAAGEVQVTLGDGTTSITLSGVALSGFQSSWIVSEIGRAHV